MNLMNMPGGAKTSGKLNLATSGSLLDFYGCCRVNGWVPSIIIQTEGLPGGVADIHLHASDAVGRTVHFQSHRVRGNAAALAAMIKKSNPGLICDRTVPDA